MLTLRKNLASAPISNIYGLDLSESTVSQTTSVMRFFQGFSSSEKVSRNSNLSFADKPGKGTFGNAFVTLNLQVLVQPWL